MIWVLAVITLISWIAAVRLYLSRERYKTSLEAACARVRELSAVRLEMQAAQKHLTEAKPKAQDVPKRYSGAQLRRLADQVNITPPEKTNSEILQEQANG
jgi:hypothetical protein